MINISFISTKLFRRNGSMKTILNRLGFSRNHAQYVHPDDVFLVSYPKSGNTWLKFIFASYIKKREVDFNEVHSIVPEYETQVEELNQLSAHPRIIKSHSKFTDKFPRVIYIIRDGRDVLVSYYFYLKKTKSVSENTSFTSFLRHYSQVKLPYGKWGDHVYSWLTNSKHDMKVIFYEDLLRDAFEEAKKVITFSRLTVNDEQLKSAIRYSSFTNLRRLEQKNQHTDKYLSNTDHKIPFVRSGKVGGYAEFFTKKENDRFLEVHKDIYALMDSFRDK